jgi:ATP-dependent 26S proteasome regulatory subunit
MESYQGLAVLTTNMKSSLDRAFQRRLRFTVTFPFPDAPQREAIWNTVFPAATPTRALNLKKLAQLNVTGGHIRNIALNASFLAANDDTPVEMGHLREAARLEALKLERPLAESELRGWA